MKLKIWKVKNRRYWFDQDRTLSQEADKLVLPFI